MDWAKAKNIIIIMLVILNLFLGWRIVSRALEQYIPAETIRNTVNILNSRNVKIEAEIPRYNRDTPKLRYKKFVYDRDMIAKIFLGDDYETIRQDKTVYAKEERKLYFNDDNSFLMTGKPPADVENEFINFNPGDIKKAEKILREKYNVEGLIGKNYVLYEYNAGPGDSIELLFYEKFEGKNVFGNYVKAIVSAEGLIGMEAGYNKIIGFSPQKVTDLAPAYQVLLSNFKGENNEVIIGIDFGYKEINDNDTDGLQSSEQPPVWRIKLKGDDRQRYFDATNGLEIKN